MNFKYLTYNNFCARNHPLVCVSDTVRYHATIKLVNITAIVDENVNEFLQQKILKYVSIWCNVKFLVYDLNASSV